MTFSLLTSSATALIKVGKSRPEKVAAVPIDRRARGCCPPSARVRRPGWSGLRRVGRGQSTGWALKNRPLTVRTHPFRGCDPGFGIRGCDRGIWTPVFSQTPAATTTTNPAKPNSNPRVLSQRVQGSEVELVVADPHIAVAADCLSFGRFAHCDEPLVDQRAGIHRIAGDQCGV